MPPLDVRQAASKYEKDNPQSSLHEAFIQGYLYHEHSQVPMMVDDTPLVVTDSSLPSFEDFWNLYDKKRGKPKAEKLWNKLSLTEKLSIMDYIPRYKIAQPDKQYRKDPQTFLRGECWNDELIYHNTNAKPTATEQERDFFEQSVQSFLKPNS